MEKAPIAFAASTGAFATVQADDGFQRGPNISGHPESIVDEFSDYSPAAAARSGIDCTATASVNDAPKTEQMSEQMQIRLYEH
ncbi:hypothetical protein SAMN05877838_2626 [Hoeflea halophila]|uniref:Uncharacterized protein n=1 Tax=Hoeflea halophila TaxID=714899 RepID=A0A286IC61_9HYPH|nr:hypothetical protein [Hoeflea halophila]SOE17723.1 hypothetical protein SAMN05877838_2626 [Hoeflea halophila]